MIEITVIVKEGDQTLREKHVFYPVVAEMTISNQDPQLKEIVDSTVAKFKGSPQEILIRFAYQWA